jgi:hypothetical protein
MGVLTWCFCGVVVVFCVVNVVIKPSCFVVIKNVTRILNLFFGFLVLGMKAGLRWSQLQAFGRWSEFMREKWECV